MEDTILKKLIRKEQLTDDDVERILNDICEDVHGSCDLSCPIYKDILTTGQINNHSCPFVHDGKAMRKTLELWHTKLEAKNDPLFYRHNHRYGE